MLRITKIADYGIVVMVYLARKFEEVHTARDIAKHTRLALPTVSKILKKVAKEGLLDSHRGVTGGYRLVRAPHEISVAEILAALDGKIALTECVHDPGACSLESICVTRHHWKVISQTIYHSLKRLNLAEMATRESV